jgi:hypothetical protein
VNKEEKKDLYEVWIVKYNDEPISVISTDKYDAAYERWEQLKDIWVNAIKDKVPFVLTKPIVTAFDPGTIKEVTLRPVMKMTESKYENPYQQQMLKSGLTQTLRNSVPQHPILDGGYITE